MTDLLCLAAAMVPAFLCWAEMLLPLLACTWGMDMMMRMKMRTRTRTWRTLRMKVTIEDDYGGGR